MAEQTITANINRSLESKKVDQFYVEFLHMPDNIANILGRQVASIERPTVTFNEFERPFKGARKHDHAKLEFAPINIELRDDDQSLTTKAIYQQIYRQLGTGDNSTPQDSFENAVFTIRVKAFSASGVVVEHFDLIKCFITGVTHSQQVYNASDQTNMITLSIRYDNVSYIFPNV